MANGHGGARPGSGPKTGTDGKAVKPYTRREPKKTRDRSPELVASVLQTHPEARRRPLMSDQAIQTIVEAFREQQNRARNRPRTADWNPYIIRPDRFGPGHKALKKAKMAMDDNTSLMQQNQFAVQAWQAGGMTPNAASEGLLFLGYPYLSELAQRPEFRLFGEIRSEEMTRKWIELRGTEDESTKRTEKRSDELAMERNRNDDDRQRAKQREARGEKPRTDQRNKEIERKILELKDLMEEMKVRACFKNVAAQDDYFGISHLHIDLHGTDLENLRDKENGSSIGNGRDAISKEKLKRGCLRGLRVIEPIWCYPTNYNAFNPLAPDWYDPAVWYVMGAEIHKTRLIPFIGRPVPDILKPAYAFGGLSMTQMAQPYVDIWLRTRESVGEIIHAFSVMILSTEMGTTTMPGGSGGGNGDVVARMMLANMLRDNQGMMVIDKNTEDFKNVSAPLGGLDDLQAQSQEHLCSVARIPLVKYTGLQPKGLNASSDGEMRAFNDTVHGQQEHLFRPGLTTVFDVMQYHLWGERDPDITYDFLELHELTPKEKAEVKKLEAETDQIRIDSGVVSQEEVRSKVVADADSGFHGLDPDDVPDLLGEEMGGMIPQGAGRALEAEIGQAGGGGKKPPGNGSAQGAEDEGFEESKHPRRSDGKFGTGGGGSAEASQAKPSDGLQALAAKIKVPQAISAARAAGETFKKSNDKMTAVTRHIQNLHERADGIVELDRPDALALIEDLGTGLDRDSDMDVILDYARDASKLKLKSGDLAGAIDPDQEKEFSASERQELQTIMSRLNSAYAIARTRAKDLVTAGSAYRKMLAAASAKGEALIEALEESGIDQVDFEPYAIIASGLSLAADNPIKAQEFLDFLDGGELSEESAAEINQWVSEYQAEVEEERNQQAHDADPDEPKDIVRKALAQARKRDRLGYLAGLRNIRVVRDRDQWNAGFDPDEDRAVFQRKFLDLPDEERLRVILHEGAHRAQFISDVDTFGRFVRMGLGTEESFLAMANEVHLADFEETGEVDDLDGEVFAESYARFCLGMEMPEDLLEFWIDRSGEVIADPEK